MKKIALLFVLVAAMAFMTSCATTQSNPNHTASDASNLVLGDHVYASQTFFTPFLYLYYITGHHTDVLTSKALQGKDADFIYMPIYESNGNWFFPTITVKGRAAKVK